MSRTKLIAANWKMNPPPEGFDAVGSPYRSTEKVEVMVFAPFVYLKNCIAAGLRTGAQCGHSEVMGAHTGAVSMAMLSQIGCEAVLCGHSERRIACAESDAFVAAQVKAAIETNLVPVLCIGETANEREAGKQKDVVRRQLLTVIEALSMPERMSLQSLVIAYEPVWAIGTGHNALPEQAQEMHAFIRSILPADTHVTTKILYGGSVHPENAKEILSQKDVDGALVGGSSLEAEEFAAIVAAV